MIVVSDTSPIANLAVVSQIDLLHQLYGKVIIPPAVREEIIRAGVEHPVVQAVAAAAWIETRSVANQVAVASLQLELDPGEAEAIALAIELQADLLLLDERKGRAIAARFGLRFIGLLGVLVEAKQKGMIAAVKPILDDLIDKAGFWVGSDVYIRVLKASGE